MVVQIGANNGKRDPFRAQIKRERWKVLFVEPEPEAFGGLVDGWKDKEYFNNFTFENCAIAESDGEMDFYVPRRSNRISGLDHSCKKNKVEFDKGECDTIRVKTMTFPSLLKKHGITEVEWLIIDTEGYDLRILKAHDWKVKPKAIHYEHAHIDAEECRVFLESKGYVVNKKDNNDSIARLVFPLLKT